MNAKIERKALKGDVKITMTARWGAWRHGTRYLRVGQRIVGQVRRYTNSATRMEDEKPRAWYQASGFIVGRIKGKFFSEQAARFAVERSMQ